MIVHCFEFEKVELISGSTGKTDFENTERLEVEKREFAIVRQHLSIGSRNKAFKTPIQTSKSSYIKLIGCEFFLQI